MAYRRGDVIAVPYEYSDLTGSKVRPAVIISSDAYNLAQPDLVVAGISTQVHKVGELTNDTSNQALFQCQEAPTDKRRVTQPGRRPINKHMIIFTAADLAGVEVKIARLLLSDRASAMHLLAHVTLTALPGHIVQSLASKSIQASLTLARRANPHIDLNQLRTLFPPT